MYPFHGMLQVGDCAETARTSQLEDLEVNGPKACDLVARPASLPTPGPSSGSSGQLRRVVAPRTSWGSHGSATPEGDSVAVRPLHLLRGPSGQGAGRACIPRERRGFVDLLNVAQQVEGPVHDGDSRGPASQAYEAAAASPTQIFSCCAARAQHSDERKSAPC